MDNTVTPEDTPTMDSTTAGIGIEATPAASCEDVADIDAEIAELAKLTPLDYDRVREERAKAMGVRVATLDKAVEKARREGAETEPGQGSALNLQDPEPWPDPVDGEVLLDELSAVFTRHMILPPGAADTLALWVMFTYCHEAMFTSVILAVLSPERRCGKTTLLDILKDLCRKALAASSISPPAIYRTVEKAEPTLLIDEVDTFMAGNEDLRGILNSGHTRAAAFVIHCTGDDLEPRMFSTWAPKTIAMIGKLPDTLMDRSIVVSLRRKLRGEKIKRFRAGRTQAAELASQCMRWRQDHLSRVKTADPEAPGYLNDRAADNWRSLLRIADVVGGQWPKRAREAIRLIAGEQDDDAESVGVKLLSDVRSVFEDRQADRLSSADLVQALGDMEDRPWPEWRQGKPITQNQLARLLKPFGIKPFVQRIGVKTPSGYALQQFKDTFSRYLPPIQTSTPQQVNKINNLIQFQTSTKQNHVEVQNEDKALKDKECLGVEVQNPPLSGNNDMFDMPLDDFLREGA